MAMKRSMKAMKAMKKGMKKSAMKKAMKKRAMKVSKVAKGKRGKSSVFRGTKAKTSGGLTKSHLKKNKRGKVVSKKASDRAMKSKGAKQVDIFREGESEEYNSEVDGEVELDTDGVNYDILGIRERDN